MNSTLTATFDLGTFAATACLGIFVLSVYRTNGAIMQQLLSSVQMLTLPWYKGKSPGQHAPKPAL